MIQFRDGFYADIRVEDRYRTVISCKNGALEEMKNRVERQAFLRVYDGKLWYYASTTDVDRLQKTLQWLSENYAGQIFIFTCHTREAEILEELHIPYKHITLS